MYAASGRILKDLPLSFGKKKVEQRKPVGRALPHCRANPQPFDWLRVIGFINIVGFFKRSP